MAGSDASIQAAIFGCASLRLSDAEKSFFAKVDPLGFILFSRNIDTPAQVAALVAEFRECVGRDAPVLIDQEGGRVQRLRPPHWRKRPPMAVFGALAAKDRALACRAARLNAHLIAADLAALGINVDCAPLIDVPTLGSHDIIGDRAFAPDPVLVGELGRAVHDGLLDGGVMPVVKHIPGHGRAVVDSHLDLPVVDADMETLVGWDFPPFRVLADAPWAMTAHIIYRAIDLEHPATISPRVIGDVIRGVIGCRSFLLSDDLSMKALSGDFAQRTHASLAAGCDAVLHCNGDMAEMEAVAGALRPLSDAARERLDRALSMPRATSLPDGAQECLDRWLAGVIS
ncbi:MAG: beta-N-acetylhexosaminidase [Rhodospirillaceae bacterium]|nr:beta-N-acetylhexosaminidase [Rhodospirillaceae bacterium]